MANETKPYKGQLRIARYKNEWSRGGLSSTETEEVYQQFDGVKWKRLDIEDKKGYSYEDEE